MVFCDTVKKNITGFCNKCRPRSGSFNPFYGKKHPDELIKQISLKASISLKKCWEDPEYRCAVITSNTGKTRSSEFKKAQSKRVIEQYKNDPTQRTLRSECMTRSWKTGKIGPSPHVSINRSKNEGEIIERLKEMLPDCEIHTPTLHISNKWYYPDIMINDTHIIEYYGSYWHANPARYNSEDYVHHGMLAKEIWSNDARRKQEFESFGFVVIEIWDIEYKNDKHKTLQMIVDAVKDTVDIVEVIKPIFNYKAS